MTEDKIIKLWEDKTESVVVWEDMIKDRIPDINEHDLERFAVYMNGFCNKMSAAYNRMMTDEETGIVVLNLACLSKIKDRSKIVFIKEECEDKIISVNFQMGQIERLRNEWNIDVMDMAQNVLMQEASQEINNLIDAGKTVYINTLIKSISLIAEGATAPRLVLKSKIKAE